MYSVYNVEICNASDKTRPRMPCPPGKSTSGSEPDGIAGRAMNYCSVPINQCRFVACLTYHLSMVTCQTYADQTLQADLAHSAECKFFQVCFGFLCIDCSLTDMATEALKGRNGLPVMHTSESTRIFPWLTLVTISVT